MAKFTDKNSYTVLFAVIMVLVVGSLLAGVAQGLRGRIAENQRFEKQQNILYAMGVNDNKGTSDVSFIPPSEVEEEFHTFITKQLVFQGDTVTEDPNAYLIDVKAEESKAKSDPNYKRRLPLFIGEKDGQTLYIIPMRGKGLWDAIWGFVAVDKNFVVHGVYFDHAGETPGLGANIRERFFMDSFEGEHLMSGDVFEGIKVAKGNNDPANNRKDDQKVDAIAGSTITGDGVTNMIKKDVGMYIPYLKKLINNGSPKTEAIEAQKVSDSIE